jgi:hypothetical protein
VPGESGTFHIIIQDLTSSNLAKATHLAQWVGVDRAGNLALLHPTAEQFQAGPTSTAATSITTSTTTPTRASSLDAIAGSPTTTTSPGIGPVVKYDQQEIWSITILFLFSLKVISLIPLK